MGDLNVLQVYNRYRLARHGEDWVVEFTQNALTAAGIRNALLDEPPVFGMTGLGAKIRLFSESIYNLRAKKTLQKIIQSEGFSLVHLHNLYPRFSPAVLEACREACIPNVLTAHNFFLTCPVRTHHFNGQPCLRCAGGNPLPALWRNCRGDFAESLAYALRYGVARGLGWFEKNVSVIIALSQYSRSLLLSQGFSPERVLVIPNTVPVPSFPGTACSNEKAYIAYAGRIDPIKGIPTLLKAARMTGLPLKLAGDAHAFLANWREPIPDNVEFVGWLDQEALFRFLAQARFLVFPSEWYEICPIIVLQAMSCGLPVIGSRLGAIPELVTDGVTGMLVDAGNFTGLGAAMCTLWESPVTCERMGANAWKHVHLNFNADNYADSLLRAYNLAAQLGYPP